MNTKLFLPRETDSFGAVLLFDCYPLIGSVILRRGSR